MNVHEMLGLGNESDIGVMDGVLTLGTDGPLGH